MSKLEDFVRVCTACKGEFLRCEMNGDLCPDCHDKFCDSVYDSCFDTYGSD